MNVALARSAAAVAAAAARPRGPYAITPTPMAAHPDPSPKRVAAIIHIRNQRGGVHARTRSASRWSDASTVPSRAFTASSRQRGRGGGPEGPGRLRAPARAPTRRHERPLEAAGGAPPGGKQAGPPAREDAAARQQDLTGGR